MDKDRLKSRKRQIKTVGGLKVPQDLSEANFIMDCVQRKREIINKPQINKRKSKRSVSY